MIGHTGFVLDTGLGKTQELFLDTCNRPKTHESECSNEIYYITTS